MGDWSNNLEHEHREYYGHFYDTDEDVHEEENGDLISRQAVLDALDSNKYSKEFCEEHNIDWSIKEALIEELKAEIKAIFPPSGNWMYGEEYEHEHTVCEVLSDVLQILDRIGKESEDT